jgi:microcystin-dependent protein
VSEPFIGEIRIWGLNFAPQGWAFADGQLLPISQNTALFSLFGTTYGGDGRTTFGLPNLQGRAPMHPGDGPGLTTRRLGETGGVETVTLTDAQMPNHTHTLRASTALGDEPAPGGHTLARAVGSYQSDSTSNLVSLSSGAIPSAGGSQPHGNMQPFLTLRFCIALVGIYPPRS